MQLVMPDAFLRRAPPTLADDLAILFGHDLADHPPIVMKQLRAASRFDASARLGALAGIPALVVSATHDRIALPRFGRALADAIPGARYVEIPDAGHGCTIQCAWRVNALLAEHFDLATAAR
jgi:aminoacrylate hydrolase